MEKMNNRSTRARSAVARDAAATSNRPQRSRALLSVAVLVPVVFATAVLWASREPEPLPGREESPDVATNRGVEKAKLGVESVPRQSVEWAPDGNLWIRLVHGGDPVAGAVHCRATDLEARSVPQPIGDPVLADADGWCVVPWRAFRKGDPRGCVLTVSGFLPQMLANPTPEVRHVVELRRAIKAFVSLREMPNGRPVVGGRVRASLRLLDGEPWEQESVPGWDENRAIYYGVSGNEGRVELSVAKTSADYFYEIEHRWCVPTIDAPEQLALGHAHVVVDMVMPMVGAVAYSGDRLLQGNLLVGGAPPRDHRTTQKLEAIRQGLAGGLPSVLTTAFVPDVRLSPPISAQAVAEFAKSDRRVDTVPLLRLDEYRGPLEIQLAANRQEARSAIVRLVAPPKFAGELEADFKLMISGRSGFLPRMARFGDSVELPLGKYKVYGQTDGNRKALADEILVVESAEPVDFVGRWRDDVFCHVLAIKSAGQPNRATVVYSRDGVNYALTSGVRSNGDLVIWHPQILGRVRVHSPGYKQAHATFDPVPGTRMVKAECTLIEL